MSAPETEPELRRELIVGTAPTMLALAVTAYAVLERATVDPTVYAGYQGSYFLPVWYVPLAMFAVAYTAGLMFMQRIPGVRETAVGIVALALAIGFHVVGVPFLAGEAIYGLSLVLAIVVPPLFLLVPIAAIVAVCAGGALFGLSIHGPLTLARRFGENMDAWTDRRPARTALVVGGITVAFAFVFAFGIPTQAERAALGTYSFPSQSIQSAWFNASPAIALCCAIIVLAGSWTRATKDRVSLKAWTLAFILSVAMAVGVGGALLPALQSKGAIAALRSASLLAAPSRYFRDGRPRTNAPIDFANGELRVDRELIRYRSADNARRETTSVSLRPTPELQALGVREGIVMNAWRAEPMLKEAENYKATCADSNARLIVVCRSPAAVGIVIEIEKAQPDRALERRAVGTDAGCRLIFTSVDRRAFGARAGFDCALADDWLPRAAQIEKILAAWHRPKQG